MRQMKKVAALTLALTTAACASGGMNTRPEDIPALEQKATAQPSNAEAATNLGIAYYNAKRYEDARKTLSAVTAQPNAPGAAYMYLGLANEELKDWTAARNAYEKYVAIGSAGDLKEQIRNRLALVARQQLRTDAKQVLAREQQMSQEPPTPRTVAVMPFKLVGTGDDLAPLQTALSDMIITDLSVSPAITSVERVKINAMIDEMLLAQAGLAEQETGARVGRLLKAEHVVQGTLAQSGQKELRMDAIVLNTARNQPAGTFGQNQQLDKIFDLEKAIVFDVFNAVGVTLTENEREKINENRTGNLLAFLTYGRGLDALDKGNFQQASTFFRQASQIDPNFRAAQTQQTQANQLQQASETSTEQVAQSGEASGGGVTESSSIISDITQNTVPSGTDNTLPGNASTPQQNAPVTAQNQAANVQTAQGQNTGASNAAKASVQIKICNPTKGGCT
jgi:tetratricopeptide (TPR) repeat protein